MTWIPTSTPPPEDEVVLVYFEHGSDLSCGFSLAYFVQPRGWFQVLSDDCQECDAEPSHWMPLPLEPATA